MTEKMKEFQSPGEALKNFLDEKDWTQEDLANILSLSLKHTNEIIKNKKPITIELAKHLENVFKPKAYDWIKLSARFQLSDHADDEKEELVKLKTQIYKYMPISELVKKGWLQKSDDLKGLNKQIRVFWGITSSNPLDLSFLDDKIRNLEYRKSEAYDSFNKYNALIWHQMALNASKKIKVPTFKKDALIDLMDQMHKYTLAPNGIKKFLSDLIETGVKFVFLSHLSKTYLDGAAFLSGQSPVIALTGRYDRIDNFWFTLAHELSHVRLHLTNGGSNSIFVDDTTKKNQTSIKEEQANALAEKVLLQNEIFEYFNSSLNYITEDKVFDFSYSRQIHPSIVVGMLAFNEVVSYSTLHRFKEPIRNKIPSKYWTEK